MDHSQASHLSDSIDIVGPGEDPGPKQGPAGSSYSSSQGAQGTRHLLQGANHETELTTLR